MLASLFHATIIGAALAALVAAGASVLFLRTRNFVHDSLALAATEAGLLVLAIGIVAGTIAYRAPNGQWWTWDANLTAALVGFLLYSPYLMLRNAIEEPTRRAGSAAVLSLFAICDMPFILNAIQRWRPAHESSGLLDPSVWWVVVVGLGGALTLVRFRQEQRRRAADAERRTAQEI